MEAKMARGKKQDGEKHSDKAVRKVTAAECEAIKKHLTRLEAKPSVRFTAPSDGSDPRIRVDHPDELIGEILLANAVGSADHDFVNGIVRQLSNTSYDGEKVDVGKLNFKLAVIKGIAPRDQLEAMLAAQMAEVHVASMILAQQLANAETIPHQDSAERALNKLTRTFAMQLEALKRYRSSAEEKVTLQHVSVADGGQAIVGNVTQVPHEQRQERATRPPAAANETNVVPMPPADESKEHDALSMRRKSA
jgi:hypothetical protein